MPEVRDRLGLSFNSARSMMSKVDEIPSRCGQWFTKKLSFQDRPEEHFFVHHRNPIEAIKALWGDPSFSEHLVYKPANLFRRSAQTQEECMFSEMWTGRFWNAAQQKVPEGGTIAPMIIAFDKTQLTQFSGSKSTYPVYLTLGNIPKALCRQPGARVCILVAYLSVDKLAKDNFSKTTLKLRNYQLFHRSMAEVLGPLKAAGDPRRPGIEMVGGDGAVRNIYPLLAAYVADYPEQCLVTCTKYGTCPKCQQKANELGLPTPGERQTQAWTHQKIKAARKDLRNRGSRAVHVCTMKDDVAGGDYEPFWAGFPLTDIHRCITPDVLHQLFQGVFKRLVAWVQTSMGEEELDQRIRQLPFASGLAQYPSHDEDTLGYMAEALDIWHQHRDYFIDSRAQRHFNITKFHSLLHYIDSICWLGTTGNYNMEAFECLHIDLAKEGWRASNHRDHFPQMVTFIDRQEKVSSYDFYRSWVEESVKPVAMNRDENAEQVEDVVTSVPAASEEEENAVQAGKIGRPNDTCATTLNGIVLRLAKNPPEPHKTLSHISVSHGAPGFITALKVYLNALLPSHNQATKTTALDGNLPFTAVDVWHQFKLTPEKLLDPPEQAILKAFPIWRGTSGSAPRYDTVLVLDSDEAESTAVQGMVSYLVSIAVEVDVCNPWMYDAELLGYE
ncbi:hypothetical protein GGU10DRAFT_381687 [Lentinula aff. detonsa]|uniref:Transposase domain-containing protein n=1 Tax=Lentinula aff. detonsa TaxID=2804958 RepID=A0AA38KK88_9AGAR|nr:hypothetical protein GGU10DRAFT_381687 [Lentinula aff. detonsa]